MQADHQQAEAYIKNGMEKDEAVNRAVLEMGDPVETGVALDRVHRPRMQWELIILAALLSMIGLIMQITIFKTGCLSNDTNATTIRDSLIGNAVLNTLIGFAVIAVTCAIDYTFLGKHPVIIWYSLSSRPLSVWNAETIKIPGKAMAGVHISASFPAFFSPNHPFKMEMVKLSVMQF